MLAEALAEKEGRATTPTDQPIDMPAVHAWFAEQAGKVGTPMTPKEMQSADEKSLLAGGWVR